MRGKDINLTVTAGVEHVREIKAVKENGEVWPIENIAVRGLLWDMRMDEVVGEIECRVTEDGKIEVKYPAMGIGRYIFVIDGESEDGQLERIIEGYIGYEEPRMVEEGEEGEEMIVYIGKEKRKVLFGRNSGWTGLFNKTIEAEKRANEASERVEAHINDAVALIKQAELFLKSFNEALQEALEVRNNYLYIGGKNTGHYLRGEDGVTPHIGSDGYWYIGERNTGERAKGEDGLTPYITSDGYWAIGSIKTKTLARGRDGIDGVAVRRILVSSVEEIPQSGETCNGGYYYYVPKSTGDFYDVYAWLEPDGWVRVDMVYDIATSNIYGLTKLSTDSVIANGAPVGVNEARQMSVPLASLSVAGVGKLGTGEVLSEGGMVGLNSAGAMMVPVASAASFGAAKLATSSSLDSSNSGMVGIGPLKELRATKATLNEFGTVRLGSQYGESNPLPYLVGVGATQDGRLANNYVFGGALQHRTPEAWRGTMEWLNESMTQDSQYFGDMFYSGILTSEQFKQSQTLGLELLPATIDLLGGVYIATSLEDVRSNAIPNASMTLNGDASVKEWAKSEFMGKENSYTKTEIEGLVNKESAKVYPKEEVDTKLEGLKDRSYTKEESDAKYIASGIGEPKKVHVMYKNEFDTLSARDSKAIYFVKRNV